MFKKLLIILALAFPLSAHYAIAMQQQQQVQRQKPKEQQQKPAPKPEPKETLAQQHVEQPQQQQAEDSVVHTVANARVDEHICQFDPEHPPCDQCGCTGISMIGNCHLLENNCCVGRPHLLKCAICGIEKLTIELE